MAWIKRNLFFVIGGILAIGLLGSAGFYIDRGWSHNTAALNELNEIYSTLRDIARHKKVSVAWVIRDAAERYIAEQWPLFANDRSGGDR